MRTAVNEKASAKDPVPKGKAVAAKTHKVMGEFKEGSLKSSSGTPVTSRKQAVAIALSEARRAKK